MPAQFESRSRAAVWFWLTVLAVALVIVQGEIAVYWYLHLGEEKKASPSGGAADTGNAASTAPVSALGHIEPEDGLLSLGVATPDRIKKINVREGDSVAERQELVVLEGKELRDLEYKLAKIQERQAKVRLDALTASGEAQIQVEKLRREQIEKGEAPDRQALESKIKYLEAQKTNAQKDLEHYTAVKDIVAEQTVSKQRLLRDQIDSELDAARKQLTKMRTTQRLSLRLADAQIKAAQAELERGQSSFSRDQLQTQLQLAGERLKATELRAPSKGTILHILAHEGELVGGQPILRMADTKKLIVRAEVYETDIARVKVGDEATMSSRIFAGEDALKGKVKWISHTVGKAHEVALDPRAVVDRRVVEVKIELPPNKRAADYIGHQVHVTIGK